LRSDTVTQPTAAMRAAMAGAPLGDDVFGDDPSVNALQEKLAACWVSRPRCLCPPAPRATCAPFWPLPAGRRIHRGPVPAHCYRWEGGGAAVFGSVQPQPLENQPDGTLPLADIEAAIKPDDATLPAPAAGAGKHLGGKLLPLTMCSRPRLGASAKG
jgi:threonine aldolase